MSPEEHKARFEELLLAHVVALSEYTDLPDGQWAVKGFIDAFKKVYTISSDTKIVSKILEIHLFPELMRFAEESRFRIVLADHQNYYPDISFVSDDDPSIKFAVDLKSTYRLPDKPGYCNGFTLGSHGAYFVDRTSTKNIQFPYSSYTAHYRLGVVYDRGRRADLDETRVFTSRTWQRSHRSSRTCSSSWSRSGASPPTRAGRATRPTSARSTTSTSSSRVGACFRGWARTCSTTTG